MDFSSRFRNLEGGKVLIYLYSCEECNTESEVECKLSEKDEQSCPSCGAPPEKMKSLINLNTDTYGSNVSWSQWRALDS